jgi:putative ABC transport system permease protein
LFASKRREGMLSSDLFRFAITLSFQQARAKIRRNVVAFAGIAGGIILVLVQLGFQSALYESAVRLHRILNGEIVVVASEFRSIQDPTWFSREWLVMTQAHPAVASVAPLYLSPVAVRNIDDRTVRTLLGIGIELDEPALKTERLDADLRSLRIPGRILFDRKSQPSYGDVIGRLRRNGTVDMTTASYSSPLQEPLTVVGSHVLGGTVVYFGTALMSAATLTSISGQPLQRINIGVVKLKPNANAAEVAAQLQKLLPEGTLAMTSRAFVRLEKRFWSNETPIGFLFDLGALIGFLISGIYIYQVLFQIVDENLAEYAVLKSMGYPNSFFTVLVVCTATILALAAIPPAVAVSFIVYEICVAGTLLDLELTTARVLGVGGLTILIAALSAWFAKRRLHRIDPAALM